MQDKTYFNQNSLNYKCCKSITIRMFCPWLLYITRTVTFILEIQNGHYLNILVFFCKTDLVTIFHAMFFRIKMANSQIEQVFLCQYFAIVCQHVHPTKCRLNGRHSHNYKGFFLFKDIWLPSLHCIVLKCVCIMLNLPEKLSCQVAAHHNYLWAIWNNALRYPACVDVCACVPFLELLISNLYFGIKNQCLGMYFSSSVI